MANDETAKRIIEVAGPIFAEKGYRDSTVREICDAAGIGVASVNYHFGDKLNLYVEVVKTTYDYLCNKDESPRDWPKDMPVEDRLKNWIHILAVDFTSGKKDSWEKLLLIKEIESPTPECEEYLREGLMADIKPMLDALEEVMPNSTKAERYRLIFCLIAPFMFLDCHRGIARMIAGDAIDDPAFSTEAMTNHMYAALRLILGMK